MDAAGSTAGYEFALTMKEPDHERAVYCLDSPLYNVIYNEFDGLAPVAGEQP